jgi:hypothetical protein
LVAVVLAVRLAVLLMELLELIQPLLVAQP